MEQERLIFLGDSIVAAGRLSEECGDGMGFGFVAELSRMLPESRFLLMNQGHDGFTAADVGRSLQRDCLAEKPDLVTLLVGVNNIPTYYYENPFSLPDRFRFEYEEILMRIRQADPGVRLMVMEPFAFREPSEYLTWRPLLEQESFVIRRLAALYKAEFVPLQDVLDRAAERYGIREMTVDGIHLTGRGDRILAEQWYRSFTDQAVKT